MWHSRATEGILAFEKNGHRHLLTQIDHSSAREDPFPYNICWQEEKDKWKVNMAQGGVRVCHNGYHGTLPCRALWDTSFGVAATQMMYYSSVGIIWFCRRRCYTSILQTFNFCFPSSCSWPGSFGALLWAHACLCWPH